MPLETETITVNVKESQRALTSIAEEFGTYLLELKMLNPEFKKDVLPHGTLSDPRTPSDLSQPLL